MAYELRITRVLWYGVLRRRCWKRSILYPFFSQFRKRRGISAFLPLQLVAYRTKLTASISISTTIGIYIVLYCDRDELSLPIPRRGSLYTDVRTITTLQIECDTLDFSPPFAYGVDMWLAWWYTGTVREYQKVIKTCLSFVLNFYNVIFVSWTSHRWMSFCVWAVRLAHLSFLISCKIHANHSVISGFIKHKNEVLRWIRKYCVLYPVPKHYTVLWGTPNQNSQHRQASFAVRFLLQLHCWEGYD